jgi:hypothetical protein
MRNISGPFAGLVTMIGVASASLAAQTHTTGVLLGVGLEANVITAYPGRPSTTNGHVGGKGIVLGYGMTPSWAIYLDAGWGQFLTSGGNTTRAGSADLGARYHFRPRGKIVVPFLQAGISARKLSEDMPSTTRPPTENLMGSRYLPAFGGGLSAYVMPSAALSGSATWTASSDGLASPRLHLGLLLSPGAWGHPHPK